MDETLLDSEGNLEKPTRCDAMRGTNFVIGLRWLREQGFEEEYLERLGAWRTRVLAADAATWVPMDVVLGHYEALDALPLSHGKRVEFGASVSRTINGVVLTTIARLAGGVGLSPFVPLSRAGKLFARNYRGGAVGVYKVSPTEARFEVRGVPTAVSACHRDNIEGALLDGSRPFATTVSVTELTKLRTPLSYAFRLRW